MLVLALCLFAFDKFVLSASREQASAEGCIVVASMAVSYYDDPQFALEVMSEELAVKMLRSNRQKKPRCKRGVFNYFSRFRVNSSPSIS